MRLSNDWHFNQRAQTGRATYMPTPWKKQVKIVTQCTSKTKYKISSVLTFSFSNVFTYRPMCVWLNELELESKWVKNYIVFFLQVTSKAKISTFWILLSAVLTEIRGPIQYFKPDKHETSSQFWSMLNQHWLNVLCLLWNLMHIF